MQRISTSFYAKKYGLSPADRIIAPIFQTGFSKHHAIYLGVDNYGVEWLSENDKSDDVRLVKASDFFESNVSCSFKKFQGNESERKMAVERALYPLGQSYNLITNNCEHYASYVQTGRMESRQVIYAGLLCLVLLILLLTDK